jgi:aminopeptidase N
MDTMDRVADLMVTIEQFSELLDEETAAIRAVNAKGVATLKDRKEFLALHYTRQMQALFNQRQELETLDAGVKSMLGAAWAEFTAKRNDNIQALQVAMRATRQVVDIIVEAIREVKSAHVERSYSGAYGKPSRAGASTAMACVSIALNKVL